MRMKHTKKNSPREVEGSGSKLLEEKETRKDAELRHEQKKSPAFGNMEKAQSKPESNTSKPRQQQEEEWTSGSDFDSLPQDIKTMISRLRTLVDQIDSGFKQARDIILDIARLLDEGRLCNRNQISRRIKKILEDKIREGKVTEKWIMECLPSEYKRKYVKIKSELTSLSNSEQKKQLIGIGGNQICEQQEDDKGTDANINDCRQPPQSEHQDHHGPSIGTGSVSQQPGCEFCPTKDAKIMELEEALRKLKAINAGFGNPLMASSVTIDNKSTEMKGHAAVTESAHDTRGGHRKCEVLQQKCEQLQSKLEDYEEVVRTHTSIKSAEELMHRSTDGFQQFEFSVPSEPLRQHMIAAFNSNRSETFKVWFNVRHNPETGEVIDVRIGRITDTDTTEVKNKGKTSDSTQLKDDTLNDITGD
jgi:hypothetical protein